MKTILSAYEITFEYEEKGGKFVGLVEQIEGIIIKAGSLEELRLDLADRLVEYAHEYYEYFSKYQAATNRKGHAPYILRLLLYDQVSRLQSYYVANWNHLRRYLLRTIILKLIFSIIVTAECPD